MNDSISNSPSRVKLQQGGQGGQGREGGGGGGGVMHSSVNEIHHHPSDSFVTFSTGATGRPQDHIPRTRMSP